MSAVYREWNFGHSQWLPEALPSSHLVCPPVCLRTPAWPPPSLRCRSTPAACPGGPCDSVGRGLWSDPEGLQSSSSWSPPPSGEETQLASFSSAQTDTMYHGKCICKCGSVCALHYSQRKWFLTHHSADELIVYGLLHKQTSSGNAVLTFVEIHRAHSLRSNTHTHTHTQLTAWYLLHTTHVTRCGCVTGLG